MAHGKQTSNNVAPVTLCSGFQQRVLWVHLAPHSFSSQWIPEETCMYYLLGWHMYACKLDLKKLKTQCFHDTHECDQQDTNRFTIPNGILIQLCTQLRQKLFHGYTLRGEKERGRERERTSAVGEISSQRHTTVQHYKQLPGPNLLPSLSQSFHEKGESKTCPPPSHLTSPKPKTSPRSCQRTQSASQEISGRKLTWKWSERMN